MMVQRWKHLGRGSAGVDRVKAQALLWHGTNIEQFQDRSPGAPAGAVTQTPSAPAWFAGDPAFSAHVSAALHPSQMTYMNAYTVTQDLVLLAFDDCADLNTYLQRPVNDANDALAAQAVLARAGNCDGYMLERDAVRAQPEYVLFAAGLAKLRRIDQLQFQETATRWDQQPGDDPTRKHTFQGTPWGQLRGMNYSL